MLHTILEVALSLWKIYADLLKSQPILAGMVSLYCMGIFTYLFKSVPSQIFSYIKGQFLIGVRVNNNDYMFTHVTNWLEEEKRVFRCKNFTAKAQWLDGKQYALISVGYGNHIFFHKRRMFYLSRIEKEMNNSQETKESLNISTYGWSPEPIREWLQHIMPKPVNVDTTSVHHYTGHWQTDKIKHKRKLDSVILTDNNENKLRSHINQYLNEKEWYASKLIPWRTGIVLEGPPGTGKTTLCMALCGEFDCNLFIINLSLATDSELIEMFGKLPPRSIVLIEDIDSYSVATSRKPKLKKKEISQRVSIVSEDVAPADPKDFSFGSLSGLLNAIDGICSTEDRILIATTNHLEKLDPALIRPGRFELIMKIDFLCDETAVKMFAKFYPGFVVPKNFKMKEGVSPATFQTMAIGNKKTPQVLVDMFHDDKVICNNYKEHEKEVEQ